MRTLDEVIKAYEICRQSISPFDENCKECPYHEEDENGKWLGSYCGDFHFDTLHYLKEFKRISARLEKIALGNIMETLEKLDNPALTMEYFSKQIDTEPIWCEKLGEWYLFLAYDDGENEIQLMSDKGDIETFDEEDLEKYPLYRRK